MWFFFIGYVYLRVVVVNIEGGVYEVYNNG